MTEASALRNVAVPCRFVGKWHFPLFSEGHQYTLGLDYQEHSSQGGNLHFQILQLGQFSAIFRVV